MALSTPAFTRSLWRSGVRRFTPLPEAVNFLAQDRVSKVAAKIAAAQVGGRVQSHNGLPNPSVLICLISVRRK